MSNAELLNEANEFVKKGDHEKFLEYFTEDTRWTFVGDRVINGKTELKAYLDEVYWEPPVFSVDSTIEDGDFLVVTGEIKLRSRNSPYTYYDYCDIWRISDGKLAELKAFVVEKKKSSS